MRKMVVFLQVALFVACVSCRSDRSVVNLPVAEIYPSEPDYSDSTQWYIVERQAPADLFYIVSTETGAYFMNGCLCPYADTYMDSTRRLLLGEMMGVERILTSPAPSEHPSQEWKAGLNYYSPYYRQCVLQTFVSEQDMQRQLPLAMDDVRRAFDYYLAHLNGGRPFVLAGFSQGGMAVVELLRQMDSAAYSRMVAAYVIGWHITDDDLARTPYIRPAKDSADVGVTICYNSVRDNSCAIPLISDGNRMAINPVNWRTDATPAMQVSPIVTSDSGQPDTVTVVLDTNTLLLNVSGFDSMEFTIPYIGRPGNYHSLEISLYRHALRRNVALRTERYLAQRKQ